MQTDIESLMEMWSKDCVVDESEAGRELIRIPILHAKYLNFLTHHNLVAKKVTQDYYSLRVRKFEYYKGQFSKEDYEETGWPIFEKPGGRDINLYMESDKDLNKLLLKKAANEEIVNYCTSVLKELHSRTFQLRSFIDYERFVSGQ